MAPTSSTQAEQEAGVRASGRRAGKGGGEVKTVLVVDDELDIVDALASLLEYEGYRVYSAGDGVEGLKELERHPPDLLIVDRMMPNIDGLQVIRAVREQPELEVLPIILISALRPPSECDGDARGWSAFLRKPFSVDELLETISTVLP
jgi:two-component system, sensor histidine kinase and response regulator